MNKERLDEKTAGRIARLQRERGGGHFVMENRSVRTQRKVVGPLYENVPGQQESEEEVLDKLCVLAYLILNSDPSVVDSVGYERVHVARTREPGFAGLPPGCGIAPVWFMVNSNGVVNRLLKVENVPTSEHWKYKDTIKEFFDMEVRSRRDAVLRKQLLLDYLKEKRDDGYDMHVLGSVGQIVFFLQRKRQILFA